MKNILKKITAVNLSLKKFALNVRVILGNNVKYAKEIVTKEDTRRQLMDKLKPEEESKLREYLWTSHGHQGIYGDDGEMQCGECMEFGVWDYKRGDLNKVINAAILARDSVNAKILLRNTRCNMSEKKVKEIIGKIEKIL